MAKTLENYDPLVQIPSGMTPAGADFPIVESHDILVGENDKRLDAKLDDIDSAIGNVGQTPIATQLSSKVNTGDIQTTVRDASSASDSKIPSEKAVRSAIDSKTINVDSTVTQGSTNAVSGGAVYTQLATKQDTLTFDTTPTASSSNPVTSGGVKSALDTKQDALTFDTTPTASSSNPVTSGGVKAALDTKQNTLTYETTPIAGSVNPVTSTGIRNAIDAAAASNLGQMQAAYAEFVADADAVLDRASSLSNGMVACSNIAAETTVGDTRILLYTGTTNANYTNGHWYYNSAASNAAPSWTDGGAVGSAPTIDNTLTVEGAAANSKSVGDAIENIVTISNTQPGSNSGNKVWIKETTSEEVQVPTYAEHIAKANKADIATNNESDNGSGTISASKAYAIGDHFYINNTNTSSENYGVSTLYKATAAIASGDAIVVGTNCEASKVADEITSLSNDLDNTKADLGAELFGGRYVKYNGLTGFTFGATGSRPAFYRNGNRFIFDGTFGTAAYYYVKLSEAGDNNITTSANTARNWPKGVPFIEGHTYKARFNLLSGSHSGEDNINVKLMLSSGTNVTIQESEEVTFTPGAVTTSVVFYSEPSVSYDEAEFALTIEDITEESLTTTARTVPGAINELGERIDDIEKTIDKPTVPTTTMGLAYSWWVNNRAVDSYGNLYFGYISDDAMIGVCCRYPDGSIVRQDLFVSEDCDDHNAPSIIIVTKDGEEYICVIGSTGHNTDNKVNCYISKEPNSITDGFDDKTFTVDAPTGYVYECSYSQAFFDSYTRSGESYNRISNFFRVRQRVSGQSEPFHMTWVCAVSDDYGDTWTLYRVFTVEEDTKLFYMNIKDTKSPWMKRIILQPNTTYANYKPISAGAVNLYSLNILNSAMNSAIGSLSAFDSTELIYDADDPSIQITNYDDFTVLIPFVTDYLYRILDVWDIDTNRVTFLFAKTAEPEDPTAWRPKADINDWILYRYDNGTITEIAHLGGAFFKGSCYVTGASFFNDADHVIYSQNNSPIATVTDGAGVTRNRQETDGAHSLHIAEIANNVITSDKVIRISNQLLARPARYDRGSIMMLCGKYREGEGTKYLTWHLGVQFLDVVN